MTLAVDTRIVRDPSSGDLVEVDARSERQREAQPRRESSSQLMPPPRLVIVDGVVAGEARAAAEVWTLLEARGLTRNGAISAWLRSQQLADRIVVTTTRRTR